jgi:hypothetical protein
MLFARGGSNESSWGREIAIICYGIGDLGGEWFEECMLKKGGEWFGYFLLDRSLVEGDILVCEV